MKKYKVVTNSRGFLNVLYNSINKEFSDVKMEVEENSSYETPSFTHKMLSKLIRLKIFDIIGLFKIISVGEDSCDGYFSYNRFGKTNKDYFIFLENPYALVNYSDTRMNYRISKNKLKKCFNDKSLKNIVCMSMACRNTIEEIYKIKRNNIIQIYPLIENGKLEKEYYGETINCLFIASDFEVKGGMDVLETFKKLNNNKIALTIITPISLLKEKYKNDIKDLNIILLDFTLSKEEIKDMYNKTHIILNPTRLDSFSLVTLESLKYGCVYIGTDVYAIPEMVDSKNGFLTTPSYSIWDSNNHINHYTYHHQKETILNGEKDINVIEFMFEKINYLYSSRENLEKMSINAFNKMNYGKFSYENILKEWKKIL